MSTAVSELNVSELVPLLREIWHKQSQKRALVCYFIERAT